MDKIEVEHCDFVHVHEDIVKDVREHMPDGEQLQALADFYKVFGDFTRIRILCILLIAEHDNTDPVEHIAVFHDRLPRIPPDINMFHVLYLIHE